MVTSGKSIIYKNVYDFHNRIKDMIIHHSEEVKKVIIITFRGDTLKWYSNKLVEDEKIAIRYSSIEDLLKRLITRFKIRTPLAIKKL